MPNVYYNEHDERAAAWLRALIKAGAIPDGEVDTRSIVDVRSSDLVGFRQCHFFAGIGGWARALRLAGWPADREVWTGSCPCQPWSVAGKGEGADDPRHLWPAWFPLICERRPASIFGEQTASADGRYWLDLVLSQLEGIEYAVGAFDLPAACVGAPHGRARLWIVADTDGGDAGKRSVQRHDGHGLGAQDAGSGVLADGDGRGREGDGLQPVRAGRLRGGALEGAAGRGTTRDVGDADGAGLQVTERGELPGSGGRDEGGATGEPGRSFWADADWIPCSDGKARPVEPGSFPLAHGVPASVGRLRGYGNAIVPQVAAEVIGAYMDVRGIGRGKV